MYRPNGSGRDSYIASNSGGFRVYPDSLRHISFNDTLRTHMPIERTQSIRRGKAAKIAVKKIDWYSPQVKKSLLRTRMMQRRHSKELSVPKQREKAATEALLCNTLTFCSGDTRYGKQQRNLSKLIKTKNSIFSQSKVVRLNPLFKRMSTEM